jgi:hypothetical protein
MATADPHERAGQRVHSGRQYVAAQRLGREDTLVPVPPDTPDNVSHLDGCAVPGGAGGLPFRRSQLHDFTDFGVSPAVERIPQRLMGGLEQP